MDEVSLEDTTNIVNLLILMQLLLIRKKLSMGQRKHRRPKRFGVRPIFRFRKEQGCYHNFFRGTSLSDPYVFFNFTRMSPASFEKLLCIVGPYISKTSNREPISPGCRLAITLRHLATGDSYPSLSYAFRVGPTTVCNIVRETSAVLWDQLHALVLPIPSAEDLQNISEGFCSIWSLPNCVGAIDGKHVVIQAPPNSGSSYWNYKKDFSTILLAVCDHNYFFTYVDIGAYGSESDGGVLNKSLFGQKLLKYELDVPSTKELPHCPQKRKIPYYFVADEAFPLRNNLMRPYSKPRIGTLSRSEKIFNYRLSRARRVIENTFGIMVARFRILHRVINANPDTVDTLIKAIVCLHNYIRKESNPLYCEKNHVDREINGQVVQGTWRNDIPEEGLALERPSLRLGARNAAMSALNMRNYLKDYVCGPGAFLAPWQDNIIDKTN